MNVLLSKEIRLVLPVYGAALLLAIVPVWLLSGQPADFVLVGLYPFFTLYPFCFGVVLLALASFGREFSLNTFPSLLAQPLERTSVWWTKLAVLTIATATVFGAWCLSCLVRLNVGLNHLSVETPVVRESMVIGGIVMLDAFSGGLWTTLLFRQVTAPFWFTILLPATIAMVISLFGGGNSLIFAALAIYSIVGFFLARTLFFHAEETGWTGGTIVLSGWKSAGVAAGSETRFRRPWAAMIRKEFQLHQIGLVGIVVLFAVHLGTLALRNAGDGPLAATARMVSDLCCLLWFVVPLVVGGTSVAEERKLGTMEAQLCLPVSSRRQLAVKLGFVVLLGGLLSALLFWIRIHFGRGMTGVADFGEMKIPADRTGLAILSFIMAGISVIAFYASSLSRNIMQALAGGVVTTLGVFMLLMLATSWQIVGRYKFWPVQDALIYYLGWPVLVAAFIWLAYGNYRRLPEAWRLWRRNLLGLMAALVFIPVSTVAVYNRAWELITPLEPAHGPRRIPQPTEAAQVAFSAHGITLGVLLPDGRLWRDGLGYDPGRTILALSENSGFRVGAKWTSRAGNHFLPGSNWVNTVVNYRETVGIRSDGTLWVSEKPHRYLPGANGRLKVEEFPGLVRFGNETNWQNVVQEFSLSVVLLKQDGTLWRWGTNHLYSNEKKEWPGLRDFEPKRLLAESDWANILPSEGCFYAWKKDGTAWVVHPTFKDPATNRVYNAEDDFDPVTISKHLPGLDGMKWRSLAGQGGYHAGIREDGTLWVLSPHGDRWTKGNFTPKMEQIGKDTDWLAATADYPRTLAAVKMDGSLWAWNFNTPYDNAGWPLGVAPVRLGTRNDWVALSSMYEGIVALAADGGVWYWRNRGDYGFNSDQPMLQSSRRPDKIENIFGQE